MTQPENIRSVQFEDSYLPVIDGVVQVVHNYASIMNRHSFSCVVCPKSKPVFPDRSLPYDVFRMPSIRSARWQYAVALPGSMKGLEKLTGPKKPDIIHVHSPFTQRTAALKFGKKLQIPVVTTFHTKYYDDIYQVTGSKRIARAAISNIIRFYNKCDSVWACSEGAARTLHEYGYQGEIFVMPNGTNFVKPADPEAAAKMAADRFGITGDKKNLLFVGTQVWQKNLRLVLDTMFILKAKRPDLRLWVAGTGSEKDAIREYAGKLGLTSEQIRFLGQVDDEALMEGLYLNADLLFFPSVYDTSSIVLREAAVMETPALLAKGSNAADAVIPDVSGFVAEEAPDKMAEKILSVIDDPDYLKKVGTEAARRIPLSWEALIPKVLEKYAEIIEAYQKRRS